MTPPCCAVAVHHPRTASTRWCGTGSRTANVAPPPARGLTSIRPSWALMILRTIASPSPDPLGLVVKNGLNNWSVTSTGTPGPSSATSTVT